jgi:hypothetical protein
MARPKNKYPSIRKELNLRFQHPIDERTQKLIDWIEEQNRARKAATMAKELLIAALNGELGGGVQWAMETANEDELRMQMEAAKDIMSAFVVE